MDHIDLSDFFRTKAQANEFSTRLSTISEKVYQTDFNLEKTLMEQFGIQKKDKFMSLLRENNIHEDSHSDVKDFLEKIQEKIATIPLLTFTIAFELNEQTLKAISEWCLLNIKRQLVFDITIDR